MKSVALSVLAVLLLSSCSYMANVKLLAGGEIRRTDYVDSVPFVLRKDLVVVDAVLNNDPVTCSFIFDTGAFDGKLEQGVADGLELEVISTKTNSTAQGLSRKIEVVRIDSMRLGSTWAYDIGAGTLTYAATSASQCIAPHGIIGANLIKLAHWKIDYEDQLLHFSDRPFPVDDGGTSIPFDRPALSGTPSVDIRVEGITVKDVLFDVGYNGGLVLPMGLADRFDVPVLQTVLDESTSGIYGTNPDSLLVKELSVELGGVASRVPVSFSALDKALLGNEILKHFTVVIDYDDKTIHLTPMREVVVQSPRNVLVAAHDDSTWVVTRTTRSTGLALGEKLRAVNGKRPSEMFSSYCDYVMNVGRLFESDSLDVEFLDGSRRSIWHNQ